MEKPIIAAKQLAVLTLDPGTYHWNQCGLSKNQTFCDGSHKGTGITPVEFWLTDKKQVALCQQANKKPPFCDGTHKTL